MLQSVGIYVFSDVCTWYKTRVRAVVPISISPMGDSLNLLAIFIGNHDVEKLVTYSYLYEDNMNIN